MNNFFQTITHRLQGVYFSNLLNIYTMPVSQQLTEKQSKRLDRLAALGIYRDQLEARLKQVETEMKRIEFKLKNS